MPAAILRAPDRPATFFVRRAAFFVRRAAFAAFLTFFRVLVFLTTFFLVVRERGEADLRAAFLRTAVLFRVVAFFFRVAEDLARVRLEAAA